MKHFLKNTSSTFILIIIPANVVTDAQLYFSNRIIDGKNHKIVSKIDLKLIIKDVRVLFDNLFGDDKTLQDLLNQTINTDNSFISTLIPSIEDAFAKDFKKMINLFFKTYTEEQIFPS